MRFFLFILLFIAFHSLGQQPFSRQLWLNENNIPVNVRALAQSTDGSLMLGTDAGLFRFNGRQFINIPDSIHQPVTAIAIVTGGITLVGYSNGTLASIKGNKITMMPILGRRPTSAINSIHVHKGIIWLGTEMEGVFGIFQNISVVCDQSNGLSDNFVYNAVPNEKGDLVCATDQGIDIVEFSGKKMRSTQLTTADGLQDNIVRSLQHASYKHLWWYGTQDQGVGILNDSLKNITNLKSRTSWQWGQVNDILLTAPDHLYISTEAGYLVHGVRNKDSIEYVAYEYKDKKLRQLLLDKAGNIWCATNQGMLMFTASFAASIKPLSGYSLKMITAITCDKDNNLWYAQGDTIWKLPLQAPQNASIIKLNGTAGITSLYADKYGSLWIGTLGKGLWCYTTYNMLKEIKGFSSLINPQILYIAGNGDTLWVSSLNGVDELLQTQNTHELKPLRKHNKNAGLGSDYVYQVLPGRDGKLWFATDGAGVSMYDREKDGYEHWDTASGFKSKVVYSVTQDKSGDIWAGTLDNGLCYYKNGKWKTILRDDGIQDLNIYSILPNATGQLVIVSQKGIDEWYPRNRQFRHYNRRLGIEIDSLSTILNCIARDKAGNVYVPYEHGFIQFKNQYLDYDIHPEIMVSSVSLFFEPVTDGQNSFSADENHISLQYEGINYTNPERLFYRYKLEGYNDGWIITNDESVTFPQLGAGKYKFRVQASLNHGFTDVSEASYSFIIASPIWLQNWFILCALLFLLGSGYLYLRIRERGLRKLTQLQRERMVFEYEHLKSQVNPHFLFNSLNTLVNLIEEDQEAAVDYTVQLSDLYRSSLAYRNRDLILLSEEFSLLEKYFYVQKRRFGEALQWQVDIPEDMMQNARVVPLALQLLVENAIKHNVVSISNPLVITIKASDEDITIQNPLRPKLSKEKGEGLGIMNIKKRYELLTKRPVYFGTEHNNYIVKLPLL